MFKQSISVQFYLYPAYSVSFLTCKMVIMAASFRIIMKMRQNNKALRTRWTAQEHTKNINNDYYYYYYYYWYCLYHLLLWAFQSLAELVFCTAEIKHNFFFTFVNITTDLIRKVFEDWRTIRLKSACNKPNI